MGKEKEIKKLAHILIKKDITTTFLISAYISEYKKYNNWTTEDIAKTKCWILYILNTNKKYKKL